MKSQKLYSYVRKAVDDFGMIEDGDKIAIGISGGKDSLTLLYALSGLKIFYPNKFQLVAITVDLGFGIQDLDKIKDYCKKFDVEYHVIETQIADVVFEQRKESNPCSLCAKMRKGALYNAVKELDCNKVAYAHHKDDFIETMMMSMIYEGHFYCFPPKTYLDRMELTIIRPFLYVEEADVIGFKNKYNLPVVKNPCPADGATRREYVKQLIRSINHENPGAKTRLFTALINGHIPDWERQED